MDALYILALINHCWDQNYKRTSLSPQLTRLKSEGLLIRGKGNNWMLTERARDQLESPEFTPIPFNNDPETYEGPNDSFQQFLGTGGNQLPLVSNEFPPGNTLPGEE